MSDAEIVEAHKSGTPLAFGRWSVSARMTDRLLTAALTLVAAALVGWFGCLIAAALAEVFPP